MLNITACSWHPLLDLRFILSTMQYRGMLIYAKAQKQVFCNFLQTTRFLCANMHVTYLCYILDNFR